MRLEVTLELLRSCASYFQCCILLKSSSGLIEKLQALFQTLGIIKKFPTKTHIRQSSIGHTKHSDKVLNIYDFHFQGKC